MEWYLGMISPFLHHFRPAPTLFVGFFGKNTTGEALGEVQLWPLDTLSALREAVRRRLPEEDERQRGVATSPRHDDPWDCHRCRSGQGWCQGSQLIGIYGSPISRVWDWFGSFVGG